jgi:hypothetical protein
MKNNEWETAMGKTNGEGIPQRMKNNEWETAMGKTNGEGIPQRMKNNEWETAMGKTNGESHTCSGSFVVAHSLWYSLPSGRRAQQKRRRQCARGVKQRIVYSRENVYSRRVILATNLPTASLPSQGRETKPFLRWFPNAWEARKTLSCNHQYHA